MVLIRNNVPQYPAFLTLALQHYLQNAGPSLKVWHTHTHTHDWQKYPVFYKIRYFVPVWNLSSVSSIQPHP
jgi:hypothetical protein